MADFTTETLFNDLSRMSVVDSSTFLAAPGSPAAAVASGGNLTGAAYFYKVTALNIYGETVGSTEVTATTSGGNLSVTVTWAAVTGATSYRVYRGTVTNTENKYFTVAAGTLTFTDSVLAAGTAGTVPVANTATVIPDPGVPAGQKALVIQRLNKFLSGSTTAVYKRAGTSAVNEIATIALPNQTYAAGVYRLSLDVLSLGSYPADYNRWAINKGKPFYIEVNLAVAAVGGDAFVTAIIAPLKRGLLKSNGQVISDVSFTSSTGSGTGTLTITAFNEYLRFQTAKLEIYAVDPTNANNFFFQDFIIGATSTPGAEGFGTSWYLTKNFRIPTNEAIRFQGLDQDERPVVGVLYNQYTLNYSAARNIGSQDVVGDRSSSVTTHVMYIPQTLASTFEGFITSAFGGSFLTTIV